MIAGMADREELHFPSGGERCAAYLYRPAPGNAEAPCVVMAHGFSATRDDRLPAYAERFAAAGLAALVFDYRHFGASSGEPRQLLDIGRQHDDYRAAVAHARTLGGIDPERIALWGSSLSGGHVLALGASEQGIAAIVAQVPFADGLPVLREVPVRNALRATALGLADQAGALAGRAPLTMPAVGPPGSFAAMTAPEAEPGFAAIAGEGSLWRNEVAARIMLGIGAYRPVAKAARIPCPVLVCVGERDETTPPGAAVKAGERAPRGEVLRYACGHFDPYVGAWFERVVADQVEFLVRQLAPVTPGP